jgi:hypothetical protein
MTPCTSAPISFRCEHARACCQLISPDARALVSPCAARGECDLWELTVATTIQEVQAYPTVRLSAGPHQAQRCVAWHLCTAMSAAALSCVCHCGSSAARLEMQ